MAEFSVIPAGVDEESLTVADPWQTAERLAAEKAKAVFAANPDAIVVGGDTVVALNKPDGFLHLAKPSGEKEAKEMLYALSGREHLVITGIAVHYKGSLSDQEVQATTSQTTRVRFRGLTDAEIDAYVATGEPMDKAGAYAIQSGAKDFVENIEGSWSNVVGLPMESLRPVLEKALAAFGCTL